MNQTRNTYQLNSSWNAPFTFSGKEKDAETGYGYVKKLRFFSSLAFGNEKQVFHYAHCLRRLGARYYDSGLSVWLSVDPLSDKYPTLSPYTYCANNPIMMVDPDGRSVILTGVQAMAAFASLQQATNLKLSISPTGIVTASGTPLNDYYALLLEAIESTTVRVEIYTTNGDTGNPHGGANGGTSWALEEHVMESTMFVNMNQLSKQEKKDRTPIGCNIMHEITEGYKLGKVGYVMNIEFDKQMSILEWTSQTFEFSTGSRT